MPAGALVYASRHESPIHSHGHAGLRRCPNQSRRYGRGKPPLGRGSAPEPRPRPHRWRRSYSRWQYARGANTALREWAGHGRVNADAARSRAAATTQLHVNSGSRDHHRFTDVMSTWRRSAGPRHWLAPAIIMKCERVPAHAATEPNQSIERREHDRAIARSN